MHKDSLFLLQFFGIVAGQAHPGNNAQLRLRIARDFRILTVSLQLFWTVRGHGVFRFPPVLILNAKGV